MLYLDFCVCVCASVGKTCPKVSEKLKRARKGVRLSIKLDVIKHIRYDLVGYFWGVGMLSFISI